MLAVIVVCDGKVKFRIGGLDRAVYALMYSRALDKNYIDVTDDSLINISIDYYADRNDDLYKEMSYYYLACIKCNSRDYAASMKAASNAMLRWCWRSL